MEFRRKLGVVFGINLRRNNSMSYKGCLKEKTVKRKRRRRRNQRQNVGDNIQRDLVERALLK